MLFLLSFTKLEFILVPISFYAKLVPNGKTENNLQQNKMQKREKKKKQFNLIIGVMRL